MRYSNIFLTHVYAFAFGVLAAVLPADARQINPQPVSAKPPASAPQRPQDRGMPMPKPGGNVKPLINRGASK